MGSSWELSWRFGVRLGISWSFLGILEAVSGPLVVRRLLHDLERLALGGGIADLSVYEVKCKLALLAFSW